MSKIALIRFGPVAIPEMLDRIPAGDPERRLFDRCRLSPGARLLVDHDHDHPIGYIRELTRSDCADGLWHSALVHLDSPPEWLKRGTPVSVAGNTIARGHLFGREITRDMLVKEISLVSADFLPAEPLAKVLTLRDVEVEPAPAPRPATAPPRDRRGAVDENRWLDYLLDRGWDMEDAIDHIRRERGYPAYQLAKSPRRNAA